MFVFDSLFIHIAVGVEPTIEGFRSALACLERGHHLTVLHHPKFPWLVVKEHLDLPGEQRRPFVEAMIAAGLGELIQITWDDESAWSTYWHLSPGKPPRRFVLNPEPAHGQTPWIINLGDKEPWETYTQVPSDIDLQAMAAFYQLPGITHQGRLEFPDEWEFQKELFVVGKGPAVPPPLPDPNSLSSLLVRSSNGEILAVADALRLLNAGMCFPGSTLMSTSMKAHRVYAPKSRSVLRGPKGQKLMPVLSSLDQVPGVSPDQLKSDFPPIFLLELFDQLKRDEGLIFDPLQKDGSLQIDPEDVPSFRRMIASGSLLPDEIVE